MVKLGSAPVYLVDASIYIFRAYFSMPDNWHNPAGYPLNAVYGYGQFLLRFLQQAQPSQLAVAFDESLGSCFRNAIYPGYKASRALPDELLAFQLEACKALTDCLGILTLASERFEADDIIATLASRAQRDGRSVSIVSRDKDLGQLLMLPDDHLWDFAASRRIYRKQLYQHFAVYPEQLVDYLALVGDPIDDIPGVPGIGKKTAASLLHKFGSVDTLYADLTAVERCGLRGANRISKTLHDHSEQVQLAQQLVRLDTGVPLGGIEALHWQPPAKHIVQQYLDDLGLERALRRQLDHCYWWQ